MQFTFDWGDGAVTQVPGIPSLRSPIGVVERGTNASPAWSAPMVIDVPRSTPAYPDYAGWSFDSLTIMDYSGGMFQVASYAVSGSDAANNLNGWGIVYEPDVPSSAYYRITITAPANWGDPSANPYRWYDDLQVNITERGPDTMPQVTHTYEHAGVYTITASAVNSHGVVATATARVTVTAPAPPPPPPTAEAPAVLSYGGYTASYHFPDYATSG